MTLVTKDQEYLVKISHTLDPCPHQPLPRTPQPRPPQILRLALVKDPNGNNRMCPLCVDVVCDQ